MKDEYQEPRKKDSKAVVHRKTVDFFAETGLISFSIAHLYDHVKTLTITFSDGEKASTIELQHKELNELKSLLNGVEV